MPWIDSTEWLAASVTRKQNQELIGLESITQYVPAWEGDGTLDIEGTPAPSGNMGHFPRMRGMPHGDPRGVRNTCKRKQELVLYHHLLEKNETPLLISLLNC